MSERIPVTELLKGKGWRKNWTTGDVFVTKSGGGTIHFAGFATRDGQLHMYTLGTKNNPEIHFFNQNKFPGYSLTEAAFQELIPLRYEVYATNTKLHEARAQAEHYIAESNKIWPVSNFEFKEGMIFELKGTYYDGYYQLRKVEKDYQLVHLFNSTIWALNRCVKDLFNYEPECFTYLPNAKIVTETVSKVVE